jgi:hypothetical protein
MMRRIALITLAVSCGVASARNEAVETRPLWERPAMGLTLQQQTEAALDRGNGRIEDPATFSLRQLDVAQARGRGDLSPRQDFEWFQTERDRQLQIENQRRRAAGEAQRTRVIERESDRLADERARWIRQMNKPRFEESAIVDRQFREQQQRGAAAATTRPSGER